jgi:prevent-host-death family protein
MGYDQGMLTITSSDLEKGVGQYLERVRAGEEVVVTESGEAVAKLVPVTRGAWFKARYEELVKAGRIRPPLEPPTREWVEEFLAEPRPKDPDGSVMKALLEERESGW